jgi:outer membrane biosynthesis protein TonB
MRVSGTTRRIALALLATLAIALAGSASVNATQGHGHKVDICHRTASDTNPYVFESVDVASLPAHLNDLPGHPAKEWKSAGTFRGVAHQAGDPKRDYLAQSQSDCEDFAPTPEPSQEVTPSPEPSTSPTPSPEPSDSPTPTPSSTPEPTETPTPTSSPSPTPTSSPEPSDTPAPTPSAPPETTPAPTLPPTDTAAVGATLAPGQMDFATFAVLVIAAAIGAALVLGRRRDA